MEFSPPTGTVPAPNGGANSANLQYANFIANTNPSKGLMVLTHAYLTDTGSRSSQAGTRIWENFILTSTNPVTPRKNVYFTFNGHYVDRGNPANASLVDPTGPGVTNSVYSYMANYQDDEDHDGTIPIVSICPSLGKVRISSYSPFLNQCFTNAQYPSSADFEENWNGIDFNLCGDGVVAGNEQCDDGNLSNGDCCSSTCTFEAAGSACNSSQNACTANGTCNASGVCCKTAGTSCDTCGGTCQILNNACTCGH
jgi:cysteine-rich repeat protein